MKWIYQHTWKQLYWPDYAWLWYFPAKAKAKKLLRMNLYDGLITIAHPFTGHLVGLSLKKKFPSLIWLVDSGDPFCFFDTMSLNNKIYRKLNYFAERQVFNRADALTVTSQSTHGKYAELFNESKSKIRVVPPLALRIKNAMSEKPFFPQEGKIRLVFAGKLYKGLRSPNFLLGVFRKLLESEIADKLELHFLGDISAYLECFKEYEELIGVKLFIHGIVDRDRVMRSLDEADILVNLGYNNPHQLPSKVIEYAATGKPILNFVKIPNDCSLPFLDGYPAALCLLEKKEPLSDEEFNKILNFIKQRPTCVSENILFNLLAEYRIESVSEAYKGLIQNPPSRAGEL